MTMRRDEGRNVFAAAMLCALLPLFVGGCGSIGQLDPAGVYEGDRILSAAEKTANETVAVIEDVQAWAQRNAAYVESNPKVRAMVGKLTREIDGVAEPGEVLVELYRARDAYVIARDLASQNALDDRLAQARVLLEAARAFLLNPNATTP